MLCVCGDITYRLADEDLSTVFGLESRILKLDFTAPIFVYPVVAGAKLNPRSLRSFFLPELGDTVAVKRVVEDGVRVNQGQYSAD